MQKKKKNQKVFWFLMNPLINYLFVCKSAKFWRAFAAENLIEKFERLTLVFCLNLIFFSFFFAESFSRNFDCCNVKKIRVWVKLGFYKKLKWLFWSSLMVETQMQISVFQAATPSPLVVFFLFSSFLITSVLLLATPSPFS